MNAVALGFGSQNVVTPAHVGFIYDGEAERRRFQLAFLRPGIEDRSNGIVILGPPDYSGVMLRHLETDLGRSLDGDVRSGHVLVARYEPDPDQTLEVIRDAIATLTAEGSAVIRLFAQVMWGAPGFPLAEDHLWVESRLNEVLESTSVLMVCAYDSSQMPSWGLINGGLDPHRHVVIGDQLAENPNYLAPAEYLRSRPWSGESR